jgi:hypothetical protein
MALANNYVQVYGQLPDVFSKIAEAQAPDSFTRQYLKDLGFGSSTFRAVIPLLKTLGFLSAEGAPTNRYRDYRNTARSRQIMGTALREAYGDLFTIKAHPTEADRALIEGKFKSAHNVSPNVARLMANTFYALLALADLDAKEDGGETNAEPIGIAQAEPSTPTVEKPVIKPPILEQQRHSATLHYNIQIHLPATKDVEVFNSIFKALKEHLID